MIDTPTIVQSDQLLTAMIRLTIPLADMQTVLPLAIQEIYATLGTQGIAPTGPLFAHHLTSPTDVFDFEISVPVATIVEPVGRVQPGTLPAATVARTVYHGDYSGLGAGWGEFAAWIDGQGCATRPDFWECYTTGPESGPDPSSWCTELNKPLIR
ncbi:MAG TPA: GyrI-like domain-containing protein [Capsulimonadaceae bacterium]|jgi:effector-binding domain-containing protein